MTDVAALLGLSPQEIIARTAKLAPAQQAKVVEIVSEIDRREARRKIEHLFPDETHVWRGETYYARHLYGPQCEWMAAGARYRERCLMAANRVGKTITASYEVTLHLTGDYPPWWQGRRFPRPVRAWAAGKTNETTRDIVQAALLGEVLGSGSNKRLSGTGIIPGAALDPRGATWRQGVSDLVDTIRVKHASGGWSRLGLKSYQQGRGSFEGTAQHVIWLDEEPPEDVYGECLTRTATTGGITMLSFTPLEGMSDVVMGFLPKEGAD